MNDFLERSERILTALYGHKSHWPKIREENAVRFVDKKNLDYLEFFHRGGMATYDYDLLTRLVVLSHELCLRAEIKPCGPVGIKIILTDRDRSDDICRRHATIEEAVALVRKKYC